VSGAATAAEPRTQAPPERRAVTVTGVERVGAYAVVRALDPEPAPRPYPGQFYMLAATDGWGGRDDERPYLPRAFSHARACTVAGGIELAFLLEEVGPGTARLAELTAGDGLGLVGPLGIGWRLDGIGAPPAEPAASARPIGAPPAEPAASATAPARRPLLVGGGIGAAPLLCLQDELGEEAPVLLGFRSAAHAKAAGLFRGEVEVATDDGSVGRGALVTDLLRDRLDADPVATVLACGPPAMLEAVRALCAERGVPAQLAMESGMACGFGACFGCVVPTREGYLRLCVDGPVLDADRLDSALVAGAEH
jgi:dihydroorotate dehydrogenase electron transfer subunit